MHRSQVVNVGRRDVRTTGWAPEALFHMLFEAGPMAMVPTRRRVHVVIVVQKLVTDVAFLKTFL